MALPGLAGERRPTSARVRLTMPIKVAPTAPSSAATSEPDSAGKMTDRVQAKGQQGLRVAQPTRPPDPTKTPFTWPLPTSAQASGPRPARAGSADDGHGEGGADHKTPARRSSSCQPWSTSSA